MAAVLEVTTRERFCIRCGSNEKPFRSERAMKCVECDAESEEEDREYHRLYHRARGRAMNRLVQAHRKQFARLVEEERVKLAREAEEAKRQGKVAELRVGGRPRKAAPARGARKSA